MSKIIFEECTQAGYKPRTIHNASADLTIAFAIDFTSPGEILTKRSCLSQGKIYFPVDPFAWGSDKLNNLVKVIDKNNVKTINIAGNTLSTLKQKFDQQWADGFVHAVLNFAVHMPQIRGKIESIRSGGQTGFDESGLKAASKLDIPAFCYAPKGWCFRNINGVDIYNETLFKARFNAYQ